VTLCSTRNALPLILKLLVVLADEVPPDASLKIGDDLRQAFVSHILKSSKDAGLEEDFGVSETVVILVQLQCAENLLSDDFAVDIARRNHVRRQDRISANKTLPIPALYHK